MRDTSTALARRLAGPSGRIFAARVIGLGAALVTLLITARLLGPDGRGHLTTFAVLTMFAATILGLGSGIGAYSLAASGEASADELASWVAAWFLVVIVAAAIGVVALGTVSPLDSLLGASWATLVPLLAIGAGLQYLATALTQLATGLGRSGSAALGFGLPAVCVMIASVAVSIVRPDALSFMMAHVAGWLAAAVALAISLSISLRPSWRGLAILLGRARPAAAGDISNALSYRLDVLLLGLISGPASVGVYGLATQALEPIWILAASVSNGLLIRLRGAPQEAWARITAQRLPAVVLFSAAGGVVVVGVMPVFIGMVGRAFGPSQVVAAALVPGIVFLAVSKVLAAYNIASGRLALSSVAGAATLAITTTLDLLLMPTLGATGAALASTVGYCASMLLWVGASRRSARRHVPSHVNS